MGLDNFWLTPKQTEENLACFNKASESFQTESPSGVEFETAHYQGETEISLVGGLFSNNGNGSFRGKYYSALCDALLKEQDWLYNFHYQGEIEDAFTKMSAYLEKFLSPDAQQHWEELVNYGRENVQDHYGLFDEYTMDEAIDFILMFEYYSSVENICLSAWY
jgi:hypothetical protein